MEPIQIKAVDKENEITLKDLILKIQDWWRYLLSKWLIIILIGAIGAGLGLTYAWTQKSNYVGELTFVLEEGKPSMLGAYAGLASQFGLDLSGGSSVGVFSGDNILEFLKSRLIVEKTLLSVIRVDGKVINLADLYIDTYHIRDNWKKVQPQNHELQKLHFLSNEERGKFSRLEDSVLNTLYLAIVDKNLKIEKPDKKLSFIAVKCASLNEAFSKIFTERLVKEAIDFYIDTKTLRNKVNIERLQMQADSIEILLNRKTYSVAAAKDLNLNPARQSASVGSELAARDKMMLQTMYAEVVKNLELSKIAMAQETPVIQVVDTPILPLKKQKLGKLKGLLIGGFLAGFLVVGYLLVRKFITDTVNS